jgi:WD40 repeat protein/serine/threonine protein kinase
VSDKASESSADYVLLNRLADEFAGRYRAGERPALQEYVDRYPELADDIRELFPAMVEIEQVKEEEKGITEPVAAPIAPALEQLGDFRILREVGKGGMGIVYEAEQVSLGRHVALKLLPKNLLIDPRAKRRFEREAKAAARLHHTNIVPVFGVGEQDGMPYYVMQFIQGLGLDEVLEELKKLQVEGAVSGAFATGEFRVSRKDVSAVEVARTLLGEFPETGGNTGPDSVPGEEQTIVGAGASTSAPHVPAPSDSASLSSSSVVLPGRGRDGSKARHGKPTYWQSVARVGLQVAEALEYAHKQGVHHRDIKPSNLLLDTQGTVWVADFGLAKANDQQDLTHTGDILGTLRYMPPEAFEGKSDARGDIYSLGLTLYEMLAFRPAFNESERNRLIKKLLHEEPVRLGKLNRGVPRDLETIVHKAIDKDPRQRYSSAAALGEDLQRFIDDEPIVARPISQSERLWRWCRRNPDLARLAALLVLVVLTGFALVTWKWQDAERQRDAAEVAEKGEARQRAIAVQQAELATREADLSRRLLYVADMQLAQRTWEAGTTGGARGILSRHIPQPGQEDLRDFEWRYLWRSCQDGSRDTLRGHTHESQAMALSPDGRTLVTCGDGGSILIWDLASRHPVRLLGYVSNSVALAPDGNLLAIASVTGRAVHLWDLAARCERATLPHEEDVTAVAFSPDGMLLASGCRDGSIRLWDMASRREMNVFRGHAQLLGSVVFSPDGLTLASGGFDGRVRLWDIATQSPIASFDAHKAPVFCMSFSADGKTLASGGADSTVQLWDTVSRQRQATLRGQRTVVRSAAFSPDGKTLATGSGDGAIRLWDIAARDISKLLRGHGNVVTALAYAPDGKTLISACWDGIVKVWDVPSESDPDAVTEHSTAFNSLAFSPDGTTLAIGDVRKGSVALWDIASRAQVGLETGAPGPLQCIEFAPNDPVLATTGGDNMVRLWDVPALKQLAAFPHEGNVFSFAFSPDGKLLVGASAGPVTLVWDRATGREVARLSPGLRARFSPDGALLATTNGRNVLLWDVATWQNAGELRGTGANERASNSALFGLAFSPDGRMLASSDFEGTLLLWDMATKRRVAARRVHSVPFGSVAYSSDGRRLVTAGGDGVVRLWDTAMLQKIAALAGDDGGAAGPEVERLWAAAAVAAFSGNDGPIGCMVLSPDGNTLATAAAGDTVRLWLAPPVSELVASADVIPALIVPAETIHAFELEVLGTARGRLVTEENVCRVDVDAVDGTPFHVQLLQVFDDLEAGATYTVRFRAKADAPRDVILYGQINEPDWRNIGLDEIVPVTEEWKSYTYSFRAKDLAEVNKIKFDVGHQTGTVWISDFSVNKATK